MSKLILICTASLSLAFSSCRAEVSSIHTYDRTGSGKSQQEDDTQNDVDPYFHETTTVTSPTGPSSITRNILQDKAGNIWLTTWEGIIRYDGKEFTNLTNKEGLRRFHVFSVFQDREGVLWFGTIGAGVYRFDGKTFTNLTTTDGLANNRVVCIYEDKAGNIWFCTEGGLSRYDGTTFVNFTTDDGMTNNDVNSIIEDSTGKIWIGTRGNACCFDGVAFTELKNAQGKSFENVRSIIEDREGNVWLGGQDGLWRYKDGSFVNFSTDFIGYLFQDSKGNLWTSSGADGQTFNWVLSRYDRKSLQEGKTAATVVKKEEGYLFGILEDGEGDIWFGGMRGVCRYDGQSFDDFRDAEHELPSDDDNSFEEMLEVAFEEDIRPLLVEYCSDCHESGEIAENDFLAAKSRADVVNLRDLYLGVVEQMDEHTMPPSKYDQPSDDERALVTDWIKTTLDLKPDDTDRISQYVVEIYEDRRGALWFGTMKKGVGRYDGKSLTWLSEKDGLPSNAVPSIVEDKNGNYWIGTQGGLCKYDGKVVTQIGNKEGLPNPGRPSPENSASVNMDRAGNIWVGMRNRLFRLEGEAFVEFKVPIVRDRIKSFAIRAGTVSFAMQDSNDNLWFKTDGDGAYKFDGESFTHYTTDDGLSSNNVTNILEDQLGRIWFTCIQSFQPRMTGDGGVCRMDGDTIRQFPDVTGLHQNDIYTIYETRGGDIWIGATGVGAYRFDGTSFTLFHETDKKYWTRNFGVQSIWEDRNGTLWFGFSGGLFRFNGKSFFNVGENGPWENLAAVMAELAIGNESDADWICPDAKAAMSAVAQGQPWQAEKLLLELNRKSPGDLTIQEDTINRVGYQMLGAGNLDGAIEVFKLNTVLHPNAFNAFDSLGEAYLLQGNEVLGVESYQKSLELNPDNSSATLALSRFTARKKYEKLLLLPEGWFEEILVCPPGFAPTMSWTGMEHLRLPPDYADPDSDWFMSYLFAIELSEPAELNEKLIADQLLLYFRGLASGQKGKNGKTIDVEAFSIKPDEPSSGATSGEFFYSMKWQEPFAGGTPLSSNIRVKVFKDEKQSDIVFVCGSPQPFESDVWDKLLHIRNTFESRLRD